MVSLSNSFCTEDRQTTYYRDFDQDGKGTSLRTIKACELPQGYVEKDNDNNDFVPSLRVM